MSYEFTKLARNSNARALFVKNAVKAMREANFNGVDIDWEFPVLGPQGENAKDPIAGDANNWALLLEELRMELDIEGRKDG